MDPSATRVLGRTGVAVTQLGLGGASYGSLFHQVPERDAIDAVEAAWKQGIRYFDTAPWYGRGLSEIRTGAGLRYRPRDEFVLSTKVGRWLRAQRDPASGSLGPWVAPLPFEVVFDYSYDGILRAHEQSQLRLGMVRYDLAVIHDLDSLYHGTGEIWQAYFDQLVGGGWRALDELRASGMLRGIGAGINELGLIPRYLDALPIDFFLVALPYTLLRQEPLDTEFPRCVEQGVGIIIGAPFQSGILASGSRAPANADYAPAPPEVLARVAALEAVCERHGVPLSAAALQFPLGHPAVASVIPGARSAAQVERNAADLRRSIPVDLWADLKHERLIREDAPVPA